MSSCSCSSCSPPPPKRPRRGSNTGFATTRGGRKKHLYLALDDWSGGYSIHRLDADDMEPSGRLPRPAAQRIASPPRAPGYPAWPMAFAAVGTSIFIDPNPRVRMNHDHRLGPPVFVFDTDTGALSLGPNVPDRLYDLDSAMAVGDKLYAVTVSPTMEVLSWVPKLPPLDLWQPTMEWSWKSLPLPTPAPLHGRDIEAYAVHPDGRTIFMSTTGSTHSYDTIDGVWRELGNWVLPFRGQAYFDDDLDAWVGLHDRKEGFLCCCRVASRGGAAATTRPPECKILGERMFCFRGEEVEEEDPIRRRLRITLTYMGDGGFCLVENVMHPDERDRIDRVSVLYVTLFGLQYDRNGDLQVKARRTTRSYRVPKNTVSFSHAAFWM
ncbi:hypothetical protein ACP70R_046119 [Stipagrostis hirtigluma subsp. patula]